MVENLIQREHACALSIRIDTQSREWVSTVSTCSLLCFCLAGKVRMIWIIQLDWEPIRAVSRGIHGGVIV